MLTPPRGTWGHTETHFILLWHLAIDCADVMKATVQNVSFIHFGPKMHSCAYSSEIRPENIDTAKDVQWTRQASLIYCWRW